MSTVGGPRCPAEHGFAQDGTRAARHIAPNAERYTYLCNVCMRYFDQRWPGRVRHGENKGARWRDDITNKANGTERANDTLGTHTHSTQSAHATQQLKNKFDQLQNARGAHTPVLYNALVCHSHQRRNFDYAHDTVARDAVARQFRGVCMRIWYPERLVHRDCHNAFGLFCSPHTRTSPPPIHPPCVRRWWRHGRCASRALPRNSACDSTLYQLLSHTQIARGVLDLGIDTLAAKKDKSRHDLSFLAAKLEILMVHDPSMTEGCSEHSFARSPRWCGRSY